MRCRALLNGMGRSVIFSCTRISAQPSFQANGSDDGYEPLTPGWPEFDLRDEPRYLALLERMNFPEPPPRP